MSNRMSPHTPPVIRVFLSSTFADMDHERSYFNEVLAPRISRICAERGVSFFSVDLRWGITAEEQVNGNVLPICLGEIDKCRPYFIGILGNRYGSILETVPDGIAQNIPWLAGKEGHSITELEMLYAVLDRSREQPDSDSAFYIRSDRLSRQLYGNLQPEKPQALARLDSLKQCVESDEQIRHAHYDSIEEFGEQVMADLVGWLNVHFPESEDISRVRTEWYSREILRNYIPHPRMEAFLDTYVQESRKSLLFCGDGARGKTTFLTAWQPKTGEKILINCGADDRYAYWPSIAREIIRQIRETDESCGMPDIRSGASAFFQLMDGASRLKTEKRDPTRLQTDFYFVTDEEREDFRVAFLRWLREIRPNTPITLVLNDLQLLEDAQSRLLSWLPSSSGENLRIICSTNDDEMVQNARLLGWNSQEMPLFEGERAAELIRESLHAYGKNLSRGQLDRLLDSAAVQYPGQLRFVIAFLINHGRFQQLDDLAEEMAELDEIGDIYRYVYDFLMKEYSDREQKAVRTVFGLVRAASLSLSEQECFTLSQKNSPVTPVEWAHICRVFEQFEIIRGDYWNIRSEEFRKFLDQLLTDGEKRAAHALLGDYFSAQLRKEQENRSRLQIIRDSTAYAKEILTHYQQAEEWEKLAAALAEERVLYYLTKLDWHCVRAAVTSLFLHADLDLPDMLLHLTEQYADGNGESRAIAFRIAGLLRDLGYRTQMSRAAEILGTDRIPGSIGSRLDKTLSEAFIDSYNRMQEMKAAADFRKLYTYSSGLLDEGKPYADMDMCQILFFKADSEEHLHMYEKALETTNAYYKTAVNAGFPYEMQRSLSMRGEILFRCMNHEEAIHIHQRVIQMALGEGDLRQYLASQNIIGMCHYRMENYDASIAVFDDLYIFWQKLSDAFETGSIVMNRCNALMLRGDIRAALESAEEFYNRYAGDASMARICVSLLGNMGRYAAELGENDRAESYLTEGIRLGKKIGQESSVLIGYQNLTDLYKKTDRIMKFAQTRGEQMEFLWAREEYTALTDVLKDTVKILLINKYSAHANRLESHWRTKFEGIRGGAEYFEKQISSFAVDTVDADKLKQQIILAKGAGDREEQAELCCRLAGMYSRTEPEQAAEYLLQASSLYRSLNRPEKQLSCVEDALALQLREGVVQNEELCTRILRFAEDKTLEKMVSLWKKLRRSAEDKAKEEKKRFFSFGKPSRDDCVADLLDKLLSAGTLYERLAVHCLTDLAGRIVSACTAEELIALVERISERYRETVYLSFSSVMIVRFEQEIADLVKDFLSPTAEIRLAYYEKCIAFMTAFGIRNAAAVAGNLALVFRRRKDKEKTLRYHNISIEAYRKAEEQEDALIEMMNMATACSEFGEYDRALRLMRDGLAMAQDSGADKIHASIAGNLASFLTKRGSETDREEILRCFAAEESYFRQSGNVRDLTISLLNQIIYLHDKAEPAQWIPKLREAGKIVRANGFKEFMSVLGQLERLAAQTSAETEAEDEASIRAHIEKILEAQGDFVLREFRLEEGTYHGICAPETEEEARAERLHILYDPNSPGTFRLYGIFQPSLAQKNTESEVQKYVEWWNTMGVYQLSFDDSRHIVQMSRNLHAQDWKEMGDLFRDAVALWEKDKMSVTVLLLGIAELSVCQGMKLQALNGDDT